MSAGAFGWRAGLAYSAVTWSPLSVVYCTSVPKGAVALEAAVEVSPPGVVLLPPPPPQPASSPQAAMQRKRAVNAFISDRAFRQAIHRSVAAVRDVCRARHSTRRTTDNVENPPVGRGADPSKSFREGRREGGQTARPGGSGVSPGNSRGRAEWDELRTGTQGLPAGCCSSPSDLARLARNHGWAAPAMRQFRDIYPASLSPPARGSRPPASPPPACWCAAGWLRLQ